MGSDYVSASGASNAGGTTKEGSSSEGCWIGTLILGPGMDDVMCAEEMESQLLVSRKVSL